jgi:hypothetical protein
VPDGVPGGGEPGGAEELLHHTDVATVFLMLCLTPYSRKIEQLEKVEI